MIFKMDWKYLALRVHWKCVLLYPVIFKERVDSEPLSVEFWDKLGCCKAIFPPGGMDTNETLGAISSWTFEYC